MKSENCPFFLKKPTARGFFFFDQGIRHIQTEAKIGPKEHLARFLFVFRAAGKGNDQLSKTLAKYGRGKTRGAKGKNADNHEFIQIRRNARGCRANVFPLIICPGGGRTASQCIMAASVGLARKSSDRIHMDDKVLSDCSVIIYVMVAYVLQLKPVIKIKTDKWGYPSD